MLDCDKQYNDGCNIGYPDYAFKYIMNNHPLMLDSDYPYVGNTTKTDCKYDHTLGKG